MNFSTNSYKKWREQTQEIFDFSVLISYAVPALKQQISLLSKGTIDSLPRPDYYRSTEPGYYSTEALRENLKRRATGYKERLSAHMLLSLFSYFEAYIIDIIKEFFEFHGGIEKFTQDIEARKKAHLSSDNGEIYKLKRKLTGKRKEYKRARYMETSRKLVSLGYNFPSEIFSGYGIKMLSHKLGNLTAKEIPELLQHCFLLELSKEDVDKYHSLRDLRNRIAHGRTISLSIKDVTEHNELLTRLAKRIDAHFSRNFFIFNEYV